jgi:cysteinyl-tRNA synthetase
VDSVLGIGVKTEIEIPDEIIAFANARAEAKKTRDFKKADALRDELKSKGWIIEDTPKGPKLKRL